MQYRKIGLLTGAWRSRRGWPLNRQASVDGGGPTGALPGVVIDRNEIRPTVP